MDKELLHQLETPCVVLDTRMAEENIKKMQAACDACGVKLRPHIKTHKMPLFAKMQLAAGADGVTCAKVGEAEVMAVWRISSSHIRWSVRSACAGSLHWPSACAALS